MRAGFPYSYSLQTNNPSALDWVDYEFIPDVTPLLRAPKPLPDSDYSLVTISGYRSPEPSIEAYNVLTGARQLLLANAYDGVYVPTGHLLFARDSALWAVPFDPQTLKFSGSEVLLIDGVVSDIGGMGGAAFSISSFGQLLYAPGADVSGEGQKKLTWINADGSEEFLDLPVRGYEDPVISPDGRKLAVTVYTDGASDIWVHEFNQPGILNRVTDTGDASDPLWTPDGQRIVFRQVQSGGLGIKNANGVGLIENYTDLSNTALAPRACATESSLLVTSAISGGGQGISLLDQSNLDNASEIILDSSFRSLGPSISSDGRYLAYASDETGEMEVYVRPFPDINSAKWRVSVNGGFEPKWGQDSNRLHYTTVGRKTLISAEIQFEPEFSVLSRRELGIDTARSGVPFYAPDPERDRYLYMKPANDAELQQRQNNFGDEFVQLVLIDNFFEVLNQQVPPTKI